MIHLNNNKIISECKKFIYYNNDIKLTSYYNILNNICNYVKKYYILNNLNNYNIIFILVDIITNFSFLNIKYTFKLIDNKIIKIDYKYKNNKINLYRLIINKDDLFNNNYELKSYSYILTTKNNIQNIIINNIKYGLFEYINSNINFNIHNLYNTLYPFLNIKTYNTKLYKIEYIKKTNKINFIITNKYENNLKLDNYIINISNIKLFELKNNYFLISLDFDKLIDILNTDILYLNNIKLSFEIFFYIKYQ